VVYSAWKMDAGFACHGKKLHLIYPKVKPDPTQLFFHSTICDEKEYQEKRTLMIENSFLGHMKIVK